MAPLTKSAEMVAIANQKPIVECNFAEAPLPVAAPSLFIPIKKQDSWNFSVMTTMTSPPNAFKKEYMATTALPLKSEMNKLMKENYTSYNDRMSAVSQMCSGKNELDRIQMASYLGSQLSNIYDYDRTDRDNPISSATVKPEDQWNALNQRSNGNSTAVSGVCRDAALTLTQFMVACGFKKDQLGIQNFTTQDIQHQIVTIRDSNGKLYTVNWSELYASPEKGGVANQPNPNNIFNGIDFNTYDADGKLVSHQKTQLGEIIKAVSGGTVDNPLYQPNLLRIQGQLNQFTANLFQVKTDYNENAYGVGASYKVNKNPDDTYLLSMGVAYVKNEKETQTSRTGKKVKLDQTIFYFQTESGIQKEFPVFQRDDSKISIRPYGLMTSEFYITESTHSNSASTKYKNADSSLTGKLGGELKYEKDNSKAWIKGEVKGLVKKLGNTEFASDNLGIALYEKSISTGASSEGAKYISTVEAQTDFSYYENRYAVSASLFNKKNNSQGSIMYSVYDRGYGKKDEYILVETEANFSFKKVGTVSVGAGIQIPLQAGLEPTAMVNVKIKHK